MIIDLIYAVVIGIVEGITEWLPISSTAHLILVQEWFYGQNTPPTFTTEFLLMFDVLIQLGAIIAVVIIYFKKLYPFNYNDGEYNKKDKINIWFKVCISCIPIIILGLLLDDIITKHFYNLTTIAVALIVYGVVFLFVEKYNEKNKYIVTDVRELSIKKALAIGFVQVLAIIPGTSRSGITIILATMLGCNRKSAMEYSFFLSIPIMFGASIYKLIKYLVNYKFLLNEIIILLVAMLTAMLVSLVVIKKLLSFIKEHSFKTFGIYRIVLGIIIFITLFT